MKIKLLRNSNGLVKGTVIPVRKLKSFADLVTYQAIEGPHTGLIIEDREMWFQVIEEKSYSEKEWNDLENYYLAELDKEREEKERAKELVHKLSRELAMKTEELYISRSAVFRLIDRLHDKNTTSIVIQRQTINVNSLNDIKDDVVKNG